MSENNQFSDSVEDSTKSDNVNKKSNKLLKIFLIILFLLIGVIGGTYFLIITPNNPSIFQVEKNEISKDVIHRLGINNAKNPIINTPTASTKNTEKILLNQNKIISSVESLITNIENIKHTSNTDNPHIKQSQVAINQSIRDLGNDVKQHLEHITSEIKTIKQNSVLQIENKNKQITNTNPFDLISIDIWNGEPQAYIRANSKDSLVKKGDVRLAWKVIDINFHKETITIQKKNKILVLDRIR